MSRPKLSIKKDSLDHLVALIGLLGLIVLIIVPSYYYTALPDIIPIHFGADGSPDGYGSKKMIWLLPIIGIILYLGMKTLLNYPHTFNYPTKITEENAYHQYQQATKMIRAMNTAIVNVFAYLTYASIQTALGNKDGLGTYFTVSFFALIFGIIGFYLVKALRKN